MDLAIMGHGGHAAVVRDIAAQTGFTVRGSFGPKPADRLSAWLGPDTAIASWRGALAIGVGSIAVRCRLFDGLAGRFSVPHLQHATAVVAPSATLGAGVQIMARAIIQPEARIGANVIVNTAAIVEHHCTIADHAHIAPGAILCGGVIVGSRTLIGAGAIILPQVRIGAGATVAAGARVTRDVPDGVTFIR